MSSFLQLSKWDVIERELSRLHALLDKCAANQASQQALFNQLCKLHEALCAKGSEP